MSHTHHNQKGKYGVLVGHVEDGLMDPKAQSPHYEINVRVHDHQHYRIALNAESRNGSDVLVYVDQNFTNKTKLDLPALAQSGFKFTHVLTGPNGRGLDYLRDGLFPLAQMSIIPPRGAGVTMKTLMDALIARAKADQNSVILAAGEYFLDPDKDFFFGFQPDNGVHDIHMMQGDTVSSNFKDDNRVNGDGALFFHFSDATTTAIFVKFQGQATSTDNKTGDPAVSIPVVAGQQRH
jgi:uncharacterized protein YukJ